MRKRTHEQYMQSKAIHRKHVARDRECGYPDHRGKRMLAYTAHIVEASKHVEPREIILDAFAAKSEEPNVYEAMSEYLNKGQRFDTVLHRLVCGEISRLIGLLSTYQNKLNVTELAEFKARMQLEELQSPPQSRD